MKKPLLALVLCIAIFGANAQTKIIKEVSDDIETQTRAIIQDNTLVGYLVFTRLEQASEDSFNYKIALMDENLNDIGTINFRDIGLELKSVAFDQDVLCLAYVKSTVKGKVFKRIREAKNNENKDDVVTQFVTLDGKILKVNSIPADVESTLQGTGNGWTRNGYEYSGSLKHKIQLKNVSGKGFVLFFGDANGCNLVAFDFKGSQLWKKKIEDKQDFALLTSKADVYLLEKEKEKYIEGGGSLSGFNFDNGAAYPKIKMEDNDGRALTLMAFGNDPVTGNPYLCGKVINSRYGNHILTAKNFTTGPYDGLYTMSINGHSKKDIKQTFVYWKDGSQQPAINTKGYVTDAKSFMVLSEAFRDYNGNTYFVGSELIRRVKIGAIAASIISIPTILLPPMILGIAGTTKCKTTDAIVMKLSPKGVLTYDYTIDCANSRFEKANSDYSSLDNRNYYDLSNPESRNTYVVADDLKNIMIYNVARKKVVRTIPHKAGNIRTYVAPAKEGHFMVIEYNKKEKYTSLSIEPLN